MLKTNKTHKFIKTNLYLLFFFILLFSRSFIGIKISSFRLGEVLVFISLLLLISALFQNNVLFSKNINLSVVLIVVSFLVTSFLNEADYFLPYTFKSSSYIWTIGFMLIGIFLSRNLDYLILNNLFKIIIFSTGFVSFIFSTGNYPNLIIEIFTKYSDKFQFTKASDNFMIILVSVVLANLIIQHNKNKLLYTYALCFLFLPLLLFQSRGSFVGVILILLFESFYFRKFIYNNFKVYSLIIISSCIFLLIGLYRTTDIDFNAISSEPLATITESGSKIVANKNTVNTLFSFYIEDGRIISTDSTTNWRLDIWQDVVFDLIDKNKLFIGYGYNEIIPVMTDPSAPGRVGRDGLNENVHNIFFTALSRGGIIHLAIYGAFYINIIIHWYRKYGNFRILSIIVPTLFVSSLDISLDGVHFPFIFYCLLGFIITYNQTYKRYGVVSE